MYKIFEAMNAKGWYPTTPAPTDKLNQTVQTHISGATNLKKVEKPLASKTMTKTMAKTPAKAPAKNTATKTAKRK